MRCYWLKGVHLFSLLGNVTGYLLVSFRHLFKYATASFYLNQISLISTPPAREEELITVCLELKPAYLGLVNHWAQTWTSHFACLVFCTPRADGKAVHVPQCSRIIGLQLGYTCHSPLYSWERLVSHIWLRSKYEFHPSLNCMTFLVPVQKQNHHFMYFKINFALYTAGTDWFLCCDSNPYISAL